MCFQSLVMGMTVQGGNYGDIVGGVVGGDCPRGGGNGE